MKYELYVLKREQWRLDAVYDDKELAVADARSVMAGKAPPAAVRVVEAGGEGRIVFKKKHGGFATLGEVRLLQDRQARMRERRERRQRRAAAEASAERRRVRRHRLVATGLLLVAAILSGSIWLYR